jgi:structural maintenance of chromosome 2
LTGNKVELALNLIDYDEKFKPAVALLFGMTFVAEDMATAKQIAFDNPIQNFNCVTLQGDSYRTDGSLGGGSAQQQALLDKVDSYLNHEKKYTVAKNQHETIKNET